MSRPVVSVIVPAYNVREYIEKAVDSICNQSLTDWEMFLIDDGSDDGTADICDSLAFSDSRIRVIHQENQGAPAARNVGIERSTGKYLYFMDGDDWAAPEMLYEMVSLAEHYYLDAWAGVPVNNRGRELSSIGRFVQEPSQFLADEPEDKCAQMVIAGFYIETYSSDNEYYIQKQSVRPMVFADKSEFRNKAHELFDRNLLYTPWNKLYLASYIKDNNIRFINRHWDDFPFNLDVIRNVERVCVTDNAYYHFIRQRKNSESEKYNLALFTEREEENTWLIQLYDTWRDQEVQKVIKKLKETPEFNSFLEEPSDQGLLTGTVGFVTVETDGGSESADAQAEETAEDAAKEASKDATFVKASGDALHQAAEGTHIVADAEYDEVKAESDAAEASAEAETFAADKVFTAAEASAEDKVSAAAQASASDEKAPFRADDHADMRFDGAGNAKTADHPQAAIDAQSGKTEKAFGKSGSSYGSSEDKSGVSEATAQAHDLPEYVDDEQGDVEQLPAAKDADTASNKDDSMKLPANITINFPPAEAKEFIARRYIERIVGCVENISNPESGLSRKEKMEQIKAMIRKDSVREALKTARPRSLHMKAMLLPVRMKSASLTYLEGALISKVKSGNVTLFARLKNNR